MENTEFTKITAEVSGRNTITVEFPTKYTTVSDICHAFRTIMAGMNFTDEAVGEMTASFLEAYYGDKYNVVNING